MIGVVVVVVAVLFQFFSKRPTQRSHVDGGCNHPLVSFGGTVNVGLAIVSRRRRRRIVNVLLGGRDQSLFVARVRKRRDATRHGGVGGGSKREQPEGRGEVFTSEWMGRECSFVASGFVSFDSSGGETRRVSRQRETSTGSPTVVAVKWRYLCKYRPCGPVL